MGRIQTALAKARRDAVKRQRDGGGREQAEVIPGPGLFENAGDIVLDPATLQANRVRGLESSDQGGAAYKMLRTRVLQRMRSNGWQKLTVTSPRAFAGKTLTAINLAISLSREPNQEVILVDLDLRAPLVASYLGLTPEFGLVDHLTRNIPIDRVLLKPDIPRLYVIPSITPLENSSEVLVSAQMSAFTKMLVSTSPSTIVIFDMPPLLDADDMLAFMPQADAVLFVVSQGETRQDDIEKSMELFKDLNILGTVLNKSNEETAADYY